MYPVLKIDKTKIFENTKIAVKSAKKFGIDITAITKCTGGQIEVAQAYIDAGVVALGDSRILNLKNYCELDIEKWLIRIPMISEAEETVKYADLSLNSELSVIEALNDAAEKYNKIHKVLLMVDLGDLREGYFNLDELYSDVEKILELKNIQISGIGVNLTCVGTIIPKPETYEKFVIVQNEFSKRYGLDCKVISGGNSSSYYMVENETIPEVINNLRLGELLLFGQEAAYQEQYDYLHHDAFILETEIIELKDKPSFPIGEKGKDAFGEVKTFEDKGVRKRIICAIGKQDTSINDLTPLDEQISIIGASSDHTVLDITECDKEYKVGDIISFRCNYLSTLLLSTSEYVEKIIV